MSISRRAFLTRSAASAALAGLDIPVYHAAVHPAVLGRRHVPWETGVTVACAGVTIQPGDILVGDADGVVVLPPALAAEVLADGTEAVLHFAAKALVGESVAEPARYWSANLGGTLALLEAMREIGVRTIVFSSTAAVYGEPERNPIEETDPTRPTNPYGASKLAADTALTEFARLYGFGAVSLRYFNVAGAHQAAGGSWSGERHDPETHLIPNVLASVITGRPVQIFGDDYATPDGTCVRDYVHVTDLADAHLRALAACRPGGHRIYNLGHGTGYSVREVIDVCREVTGGEIGADVLFCSPYKFCGPHLGVAYGRAEVTEQWRPYKARPAPTSPLGRSFETGTQPYELLAGFNATIDYLDSIGGFAAIVPVRAGATASDRALGLSGRDPQGKP